MNFNLFVFITMALSEAPLKKLCKEEVSNLAFDYQSKFDSTLIQTISVNWKKTLRSLDQNWLLVNLSKECWVMNMERQSWSNSQYSRWECLEVTGNPDSIESKDPQQTLLKVFEKMEVMVDPANVEDCHRIKTSNGFENFRNEKMLQKCDFQRRGWNSLLPKSGSKFTLMTAHVNITNYFGKKCKSLQSNQFFHAFWVANGTVRF